jgi:hypothetical protein
MSFDAVQDPQNVLITNSPIGIDYFHEVAEGNVVGHSLVHKFGRNNNVGLTYEPLSIGAIYQTPQVSGATTLRVKAGGNVNDNQAGSGARSIYVEGVDSTGALVSEVLLTNATDGTLVGVTGTQSFLRVFRSYVASSGTYATAAAGSHSADIVIEDSAGTADWLTINSNGFARGQGQIGVYTVPLGKKAYVYNYLLTTDSNKAVDFIFFQRQNILETSAPYSGMRAVVEEVGLQGSLLGEFKGGQAFGELTDIGWMVKAAAAAEVTVDFEIMLADN